MACGKCAGTIVTTHRFVCSDSRRALGRVSACERTGHYDHDANRRTGHRLHRPELMFGSCRRHGGAKARWTSRRRWTCGRCSACGRRRSAFCRAHGRRRAALCGPCWRRRPAFRSPYRWRRSAFCRPSWRRWTALRATCRRSEHAALCIACRVRPHSRRRPCAARTDRQGRAAYASCARWQNAVRARITARTHRPSRVPSSCARGGSQPARSVCARSYWAFGRPGRPGALCPSAPLSRLAFVPAILGRALASAPSPGLDRSGVLAIRLWRRVL